MYTSIKKICECILPKYYDRFVSYTYLPVSVFVLCRICKCKQDKWNIKENVNEESNGMHLKYTMRVCVFYERRNNCH